MNIPVRHPDDLARYYRSLGERRGAVPAQRIADAVGERCRKCGKGPKTNVSNGDDRPGRKKWRMICASCEEPWDGEELHVLRQHEKHAGQSKASEPAWLEDWRRIKPIFENRPRELEQARWDYCMVAYLAFLDPTLGTYERASAMGRDRMPGEQWTPARVRAAVAIARAIVERRGIRRGFVIGKRGQYPNRMGVRA